jgi:hypothetical protein
METSAADVADDGLGMTADPDEHKTPGPATTAGALGYKEQTDTYK